MSRYSVLCRQPPAGISYSYLYHLCYTPEAICELFLIVFNALARWYVWMLGSASGEYIKIGIFLCYKQN